MFKKLLCTAVIIPFFVLNSYALSAQAYAVMDGDTGTLLCSSNADTRLPMASTTKIMTGLLACESPQIDKIIRVPASCAGIEGSSMYLKADEEIPFRDVLYGLMLCSGNDAAECIAEICGGRDAFINKMNDKAAQLGLSRTHFDNPSGLDGKTHFTTAAELARLTAYALKNPVFAEIVSTSDYTSGIHYMHNHNKMLTLYPDCIGVKTGFTKSSGRCLVSAAKRDGRTVIAVTLNDPDDWSDHTQLLNSAFSGMQRQTMLENGECAASIPVICGTENTVNAICVSPLEVSVLGNERAELKVSRKNFVYAPIKAGTVLGSASVTINGTVMQSVPLKASQDVPLDETQEKLSLWDKFRIRFLSGK